MVLVVLVVLVVVVVVVVWCVCVCVCVCAGSTPGLVADWLDHEHIRDVPIHELEACIRAVSFRGDVGGRS